MQSVYKFYMYTIEALVCDFKICPFFILGSSVAIVYVFLTQSVTQPAPWMLVKNAEFQAHLWPTESDSAI